MSKPIVLAGATVALSLATYLLWPSSNGGFDEDDVLPKEVILEIFTTLIREMPGRMAPLMQQLQQIKAQNPQVNEIELQKVVVQNFDNMLKGSQEKLFAQKDLEESEVKQSTMYYLAQKDEAVCGVVDSFRQVYAQYGGEVEVDVPAGLTEEKMCEVLEEYIKAKSQANTLIIMELQRSQGRMTDQQNQALSEHVTMLVSAALRQHGLTVFEWAAAEKEFLKTSAKFRQRHEEDAAESNAQLASMGGQ